MEPTSAWISVYSVEQCQVIVSGWENAACVIVCNVNTGRARGCGTDAICPWASIRGRLIGLRLKFSWQIPPLMFRQKWHYIKEVPLFCWESPGWPTMKPAFTKNKIKQKMKWIKNARKKEKDKFAIFVSFQRTVNASSTSGRLMVIPVVV